MASATSFSVALLPIQPRYATAIIRGEKRVEFRRRRFARSVEYVVIYASSPIKRVLGFFRISGITEGHPAELWERYHLIGAIGEEEYRDYYYGTDHAVAIEIDGVCVLHEPMPLTAVDESLRAPQSFTYIDHELLDRLRPASIELGALG